MSVPQHEPNLILAGFMGTGKSTVGATLAQMMHRTFADTDVLIEHEAGMTVSEIFTVHGEAAFRVFERNACRQVAENSGQVVAIGGGALLDRHSRAILEASGVLVLLSCRADILVQRLAESAARGERPLLKGEIHETVSRLLEERHPVYSSVGLQVDTTCRTSEQVAKAVLVLYRRAVRVAVKAGIKWA